MQDTIRAYDQEIEKCKEIFSLKMNDYGGAWRILRLPSLTDQIFIKARRIRSIEEKGERRIDESQESEFMGIINYSVIATIQFRLGISETPDLNLEEALSHYEKIVDQVKSLMIDKNHDYGEAWRSMRISSLTDLILQKILRIKQIENNKGKSLVSEGLEANYFDMINYSVFALIKLRE